VLVELGLVEQRYRAVLEVLDGATVTDVARRNGVVRQTVHDWLRRYAAHGLAGLADRSSRPQSCPHQMDPEVEAAILELRRPIPAGAPAPSATASPVTAPIRSRGRSSIYRCLVRHGLISPQARRKRRSDYKRWERSRAMELWQMDIVGGVILAGGREAKIVTGVDDHSRFCVSAHVGPGPPPSPPVTPWRWPCAATACPTRSSLTTARSPLWTGAGEVLFARTCRENGIKHLLTAPRSPTTTGKVERFRKTLRAEFLTGKVFASVEDAQAALDVWVTPPHHRATESEHRHGGTHRAVPPGRSKAP